MCSICGVGLFRDTKISSEQLQSFFTELFVRSQIGGRSASGVSVVSDKRSVVLKHHLSSEELTKTNRYKELMSACVRTDNREDMPYSILGHCRFPTKGSPEKNQNNHPIISGRIIGVHNGVIDNDDFLFKSYNLPRQGEVDTEIIFALVDFFASTEKSIVGAIEKTVSRLNGSYACAVQTRNAPNLLILFRNYNSTSIRLYPSLGFVAFATHGEHLNEAQSKAGIEEGVSIFYEANSLLIFNLENKMVYRNKHAGSNMSPALYGRRSAMWPY